MKQIFRDSLHLSKANIERLTIINNIIEQYAEQGYKLTLRQLYYQLVSKDIIPNRVQEYQKLSGLLVKGRMGGVVDWDAIEDRIRRPQIPYKYDGVADAIQDTARTYRRDRQEGQSIYIEVWVEKDALSGVLKRVTQKYHIYLMVNRGYTSCTALYDTAQRAAYYLKYKDRGNFHILYFGDHDPSGLDMLREVAKIDFIKTGVMK